jgi:MFS family permease
MPTLSRLRKLLNHPLVLALYVPSVLFALAYGVLNPILPLYAAGFEVSYGLVGLVLSAQSLGMLLADVPAGMLLGRVGRKRAMVLGLALVGGATASLFWAESIVVVIGSRLIAGMGQSLFGVARHTYLTEAVEPENRGRAIALFGGTFRMGRLVGPIVGGVIGAALGLRAGFLLYGALVLGALICVALFGRESEMQGIASERPAVPENGATLLAMLRAHYRVLMAAGSGQLLAQMTRAGWMAIVPLYGADVLGLDVDAIGLILSLLAAADLAMFLPTGFIMDRWGRKRAIVPSFTLQSVGLALIPLTSSFAGLMSAALVIGFGNGLGSGTMMTLGADLAPAETRGTFLGVWRLIGDTGVTLGPLIAGAVADLLVLGTASLVAAGGGFAAALVFAVFVPETLKRRRRVVS